MGLLISVRPGLLKKVVVIVKGDFIVQRVRYCRLLVKLGVIVQWMVLVLRREYVMLVITVYWGLTQPRPLVILQK